MTGKELLDVLRHFEEHAPSLLEAQLYATFGNDENGNADVFLLENVVPAGNLECNGAAERLGDPARLVLMIEEDN